MYPKLLYFQHSCEAVEENRLEDSLLEKKLSVQIKQCMEALTHPDLDWYTKEVGREDHHLVSIVNFFKKYDAGTPPKHVCSQDLFLLPRLEELKGSSISLSGNFPPIENSSRDFLCSIGKSTMAFLLSGFLLSRFWHCNVKTNWFTNPRSLIRSFVVLAPPG